MKVYVISKDCYYANDYENNVIVGIYKNKAEAETTVQELEEMEKLLDETIGDDVTTFFKISEFEVL